MKEDHHWCFWFTVCKQTSNYVQLLVWGCCEDERNNWWWRTDRGSQRMWGEWEHMRTDHIWHLGLRSQKYGSQGLLQTTTWDVFTKPTEVHSFSGSLSLKSAVYSSEWDSVALLCIWICICHRLRLFMRHCDSLINHTVSPPEITLMELLICGSDL